MSCASSIFSYLVISTVLSQASRSSGIHHSHVLSQPSPGQKQNTPTRSQSHSIEAAEFMRMFNQEVYLSTCLVHNSLPLALPFGSFHLKHSGLTPVLIIQSCHCWWILNTLFPPAVISFWNCCNPPPPCSPPVFPSRARDELTRLNYSSYPHLQECVSSHWGLGPDTKKRLRPLK